MERTGIEPAASAMPWPIAPLEHASPRWYLVRESNPSSPACRAGVSPLRLPRQKWSARPESNRPIPGWKPGLPPLGSRARNGAPPRIEAGTPGYNAGPGAYTEQRSEPELNRPSPPYQGGVTPTSPSDQWRFRADSNRVPRLTTPVLCQVSFGTKMERVIGLEPTASALATRRSTT